MDPLYPGIRRIIKIASEELDKAGKERFSARDGESFYRLLGAHRGVSEALVNYARSTDTIDWAQWSEERF